MSIHTNHQMRSDSKSKKKYDKYVADNSNKPPVSNKNNSVIKPPHLRTGSDSGFSFVGQFGALDCSIGSIFRDEFGKNLKMPKSNQEQLGRALSVLIIDDSIIQRKLTMRTLGGLIDEVMWMVEGAENGECALNLIETSPRVPDVIIVDQYMETSGGILLGHEVVAELRRNVSFDCSVIIGCTGSIQEVEAFFLEAGCDKVWAKPMPSKDEAHAQIMTLLRKRKNNSILVSETIPTGHNNTNNSSSSPPPSLFTLENSSGFSSGVGGGGGVGCVLQQQQRQDTQPPVFSQMLQSNGNGKANGNGNGIGKQESPKDNQGAYFVSATASDGSGQGSVFQFGAPPSPATSATPSISSAFTDSKATVLTSPHGAELNQMTENLSNVHMTTKE